MKKAFTLAETLLTLMIIGVIASLTIPSLMYSAQNRDNVARLKKVSGILSTSTGLIQLEEGPVDGWEWVSEQNIADLYKAKFKVEEDCGTGKGCFSEGIKGLNGSSLEDIYNSASYYKMVLADGTCVALKACGGGCSPADYGLDPSAMMVGGFMVDLNGPKGPNVGGKDIFFFGLVKDKGVQIGGSYSTNGCTLSHGSNGLNCGALVIKEDKISYW